MENTVFIINSYRWGDCLNDSYTVGAKLNLEDAIEVADAHCASRGGNYVCVVESCSLTSWNEDDDDTDDGFFTKEVYATSNSISFGSSRGRR